MNTRWRVIQRDDELLSEYNLETEREAEAFLHDGLVQERARWVATLQCKGCPFHMDVVLGESEFASCPKGARYSLMSHAVRHANARRSRRS